MAKRIAVVGAGWSGAVVGRELHDAGCQVEMFEQAANIGGHARMEWLNGVMYEPNGAHIFHTSNPSTRDYVNRFGLLRPYEHRVLTQIYLDENDDEPVLVKFPPQIDELKTLRIWPQVEQELAQLPPQPAGEDFETFVTSMMGPTLFRLFIRDYTQKQWGRPASELSSSFAPKRVDLRSDGYDRLFRDTFEYFPAEGYNSVIEAIVAPLAITCGVRLTVDDLDALAKSYDAVVLTGPLDTFLHRDGELEWRGIRMVSRYTHTEDPGGTVTAAYVVNHPSARVPYTRTVETKHASGQQIGGTVVSEEFPGAPARHYPLPTVDRRHEKRNEELKQEILGVSPLPLFFCGRLANYVYINQDQAIESALEAATEVGDALGIR